MKPEDETVEALRERLARLEAQQAPPVSVKATTAGSGFVGGFFGCLGVLAAIVAIVVALYLIGSAAKSHGSSLASGPTTETAAAEPRDYLTMCVPALALAKKRYAALRGVEPTINAPKIITPSAPVEIECDGKTPRGAPVTYRATILCKDPLDRGCVIVTGASGG